MDLAQPTTPTGWRATLSNSILLTVDPYGVTNVVPLPVLCPHSASSKGPTTGPNDVGVLQKTLRIGATLATPTLRGDQGHAR